MGTFWKAAAAAMLLATSLLHGAAHNIVVTSAASFTVGLPPQGSIGTIFCVGLSVPGLLTASSLPLPMSLAGVTVTVSGAPAPLFAVAELGGYQQINFQVPFEAPITGPTAPIVIQQNGSQGTANANWSNSPGDFFLISGTQYGIFQHSADYSLVTAENPAAPGEILVTYLTGVPATTNPAEVPTGQPTPLKPLTTVYQFNNGTSINTFNMVVNGAVIGQTGDPTAIPFFGLTPGLVGVYQINFVLPSTVPSGNTQIQLQQTFCQPAFGQCLTPDIQTRNSGVVLLPVR